MDFPLFESLYAFTGVMIFIGILIEVRRLWQKKEAGTVDIGLYSTQFIKQNYVTTSNFNNEMNQGYPRSISQKGS